MSQAQLSTVDFHGNSLYLVEHQNEPFTPMRPIVEGMGLDWPSQYRKLNTNKERWGVVMLTTPIRGEEFQALCMPVRKLPAFFASISANKVRADLRATIVLFQTECDDALWKYWTGQQVKRVQPVTNCHALESTMRLSTSKDTERKALNKLVKVWAGILGGHPGETMPRCNTQVAAKFAKTTVDEMTIEEIRAAITWVQGKIDALMQGQVVIVPAPKPQPDPEQVERRRMAEENIAQLRSLCNDFHFASERLFKLFIKDDMVQSLNIAANLNNYALLTHYQHMAEKV